MSCKLIQDFFDTKHNDPNKKQPEKEKELPIIENKKKEFVTTTDHIEENDGNKPSDEFFDELLEQEIDDMVDCTQFAAKLIN